MKVVARFRFSYLPHTIVDNHETPLSSTCPHQPTTTPQSLKDPKPAPPPSQTTSPERNPDILDDAEVQTEHRCSEPDPMFRTAPRHSNSTTRQVKRCEGMENPPPMSNETAMDWYWSRATRLCAGYFCNLNCPMYLRTNARRGVAPPWEEYIYLLESIA